MEKYSRIKESSLSRGSSFDSTSWVFNSSVRFSSDVFLFFIDLETFEELLEVVRLWRGVFWEAVSILHMPLFSYVSLSELPSKGWSVGASINTSVYSIDKWNYCFISSRNKTDTCMDRHLSLAVRHFWNYPSSDLLPFLSSPLLFLHRRASTPFASAILSLCYAIRGRTSWCSNTGRILIGFPRHPHRSIHKKCSLVIAIYEHAFFLTAKSKCIAITADMLCAKPSSLYKPMPSKDKFWHSLQFSFILILFFIAALEIEEMEGFHMKLYKFSVFAACDLRRLLLFTILLFDSCIQIR